MNYLVHGLGYSFPHEQVDHVNTKIFKVFAQEPTSYAIARMAMHDGRDDAICSNTGLATLFLDGPRLGRLVKAYIPKPYKLAFISVYVDQDKQDEDLWTLGH